MNFPFVQQLALNPIITAEQVREIKETRLYQPLVRIECVAKALSFDSRG